MRQAYSKPSMEWIDFNHEERIAASGTSGGTGPCSVTWTNVGINHSCESKIPVYTNIVYH